MLPYSRGLILGNPNNYRIVKTETVFGFHPTTQDSYMKSSFNSAEPLEWIFTQGNFAPRSLQDEPETSRERKLIKKTTVSPQQRSKKKKKNKHIKDKLKRKGRGKEKKCKLHRKHHKLSKMHKKYMMPVILGLLAAKSLLIPIAFKVLAFISAKGLIMGLFSTIMASVLSLKGMFDQSHIYQNRKDDTKTQVEIIQVPSKSEDHVYYDEHYRRGDYVPVAPRFEQRYENQNSYHQLRYKGNKQDDKII